MAISFNQNFYLNQKLEQLQEAGETGFETVADVLVAIQSAGLTAEAHYEQYGAAEGLSPSSEFDTNAYLSAKLADLQASGETQFETNADVLEAFNAAGLSPLEHFNQYGEAEGLSPLPEASAGLTEALIDLNDAEDAVENFLLEDAASNGLVETYIEDNTLDAESVTDVRDSISQLRTDTISELNNNQLGDVSGSVSANRSDAFNSAVIAEQRDVYEEELTTAQEDVSEVAGLNAAVSSLVGAEESYNGAIDAHAEASTAADGEEAKVAALNAGVTNIADGAEYPASANEISNLTSGNVILTSDEGDLITVNADDEVVIADRASDFSGIDALYAAVMADFNAIIAEENAASSFESSLADVLAAENPEIELADSVTLTDSASTPVSLDAGLFRDADGKVYAYDNASTTTADTLDVSDNVYEVISYEVSALDGSVANVTIGSAVAVTDVNDYTAVTAAANNTVTVETNANDLDVSSYYNTSTDSDGDTVANEVGYEAGYAADAPLSEALSVAQNELNDFEEAVEEYQAIKALSEELDGLDTAETEARGAIEDDVEDGGLGITLLDLGDSVTSGDDLILFSEDEGTTTSVANFGAQGEDSIYFGGDFSLTALGDSSITDRVGDVSTNDIFWEEDATGLTLYVEADAAAGFDRDGAAQDQMTTIKLAGVSSDDINFEGGFLSAGEIA